MSADDRQDGFEELDDTLADGPSPAEVPADARPWLSEQRTMHGLLRALHTADATAREGRVAAILEKVDRHGVVHGRQHWLAVAAAALVLATVGVWFALPQSLPTADAAMQRAVGELSREVDRRFAIKLLTEDRRQRPIVRQECELVTRPGKRFLIEGQFAFVGLRLGRGRIGCDGEQVWVLPPIEKNRRSGPLADREKLLEGLGDILDVGYLDVLSLVEKLPGDFRLRTVGRVTDANGREQLRIEARRRRTGNLVKVRSAQLLVDQPTGMVMRFEAELRPVNGRRRTLVIEYLGEAEPGTTEYGRPW